MDTQCQRVLALHWSLPRACFTRLFPAFGVPQVGSRVEALHPGGRDRWRYSPRDVQHSRERPPGKYCDNFSGTKRVDATTPQRSKFEVGAA